MKTVQSLCIVIFAASCSSVEGADHLTPEDIASIELSLLRHALSRMRAEKESPIEVLCVGVGHSVVADPGTWRTPAVRRLRETQFPAALVDRIASTDFEFAAPEACSSSGGAQIGRQLRTADGKIASMVELSEVRWKPLSGPEMLLEMTWGGLHAKGYRCSFTNEMGSWALKTCEMTWVS